MYVSIGSRRGYFGVQISHVIRLIDWSTVDQGVRGFYIRLGRHLLGRSFVLNSNSISIQLVFLY
jgi:hypothetical protein